MKNALTTISHAAGNVAAIVRQATCPALTRDGAHRMVAVTVKARAQHWPHERDTTTTRCICCGAR